MGLVLIKERTLGIIEHATEPNHKNGIYRVQSNYPLTLGRREYRIKAIGWSGNPYVFNFFRFDLEQSGSFNKAWLSTVSAINSQTLLQFKMMLIVERTDRNFKLPTVIEVFCKEDILKPGNVHIIIRDCGDTRDRHLISSDGKDVPNKIPLKDIKFIESILI